jgi:ankyrin repeat protein
VFDCEPDEEEQMYFKAFLICCKAGSLDTIKCFLNHRLNPSYSFNTTKWEWGDPFEQNILELGDYCVPYESMTGFEFACCNGNLEIVKFFVNDVPRFNFYSAKHCCNETPLHLAARSSNVKLFKFLLDLGFKIDTLNELNQYPLDIACESENFKIVQFLVTQNEKDLHKRKFHIEYIFSLIKKKSFATNDSVFKYFLPFNSDIF